MSGSERIFTFFFQIACQNDANDMMLERHRGATTFSSRTPFSNFLQFKSGFEFTETQTLIFSGPEIDEVTCIRRETALQC